MNIEKIEINGHHIWVDKDAEIKEGDWFYNPRHKGLGINYNPDGCYKIVAQDTELNLEGVPSFGEYFHLKDQEILDIHKKGFQDGYKIAEKELFTEEDMRKAIKLARKKGDYNFDGKSYSYINTEEEIIEQLKQSKTK